MGRYTRKDIVFDREKHKYFVGGKELSGVTSIVGKRVGKTFDKARGIQRVQDACDFGSKAHEEIEYFLKEGTDIIHPSLKFVQEFIEKRFPVSSYSRYSEFLVSDYEKVATAIDLMFLDSYGYAYIFDLKTGVFDRPYCSWQLGLCKYLLEYDGDIKVKECGVVSLRDKYVYRVIPKTADRCKSLLGKNN
jgi:hypothetical protein